MQLRSCEQCGGVFNMDQEGGRSFYSHACQWEDERVDTSEWVTAKKGKDLRPRRRSGPMLRLRSNAGEWVR